MSTCSIWWSQIIRDQTLSLPPPWLGLSCKTHYSFQPSCCSLISGVGGQPCGLIPNKSFLFTHGVVFIRQYLTSGAVNRTFWPGAVPLAFVSCPLLNPDCWIDPMCLLTDQTATGWFCSPCLSHVREAKSWPRSILFCSVRFYQRNYLCFLWSCRALSTAKWEFIYVFAHVS
jgi:hypothetical protein